MMFRTHLAIGFLIGLFLIPVLKPSNQILFMLLIIVGAALPDIDHPKSKMGRKAKIIGFLFEHRGFFHSLFAVLLFYLLVMHFAGSIQYGAYVLAFVTGYFSHILLDSLTREGVMPFHPISKFRLNGFISTGGGIEYIIFVLLLAVSIWRLLTLA